MTRKCQEKSNVEGSIGPSKKSCCCCWRAVGSEQKKRKYTGRQRGAGRLHTDGNLQMESLREGRSKLIENLFQPISDKRQHTKRMKKSFCCFYSRVKGGGGGNNNLSATIIVV